jgi:hypothetical protein
MLFYQAFLLSVKLSIRYLAGREYFTPLSAASFAEVKNLYPHFLSLFMPVFPPSQA